MKGRGKASDGRNTQPNLMRIILEFQINFPIKLIITIVLQRSLSHKHHDIIAIKDYKKIQKLNVLTHDISPVGEKSIAPLQSYHHLNAISSSVSSNTYPPPFRTFPTPINNLPPLSFHYRHHMPRHTPRHAISLTGPPVRGNYVSASRWGRSWRSLEGSPAGAGLGGLRRVWREARDGKHGQPPCAKVDRYIT